MPRPNAGDDSSPHSGDGGPRRTPTQLAADPAFTGTYASIQRAVVRPGRRWLFAGDSITNGSSATNFVRSYSRQAVHMAGTLYASPDSVEGGTSGYTSAQLLAYLPTLLSTYTPDAVHIQIGTNDAGQSVPLATYQANVMACVTAAKKSGAVVTIGTVPPRGNSSANVATIRPFTAAYNMWLRLWAPAQGIELADAHAALCDSTTGDYLAAYDSGDGVHPNNLGHMQIAKVVSAAMLRAMGSTTRPTMVFSANPTNLATNPLMVTAGTSPTGSFSVSSTGTAPTVSCVADATGLLPAGQWAQIDLNAAATSAYVRGMGVSTTGWSIGDTVILTGLVQIEVVSGNWETARAADTASVTYQIRDASSGLTKLDPLDSCGGRIVAPGIYQIGPIWVPWTIPVGTTGSGFYIAYGVGLPSGVEVKAKFGAAGIFNASTLGITPGAAAMVNVDGP